MKNKSMALLGLILVLVLASVYIAVNGITIGETTIPNLKDSINLGLELQGGMYVVLEADTDATGEELARIMEQSRSIISNRVDDLGVAEPNISIEGDNRIRIELAGVEDPKKAMDLIGKTAQLQFVTSDGQVILTGQNVKGSKVMYQDRELGQREPIVTLELDEEGRQIFAEVTGILIDRPNIQDRLINIILDDEIISSPAVQSRAEGGEAIKDGTAIISGDFDFDTAVQLSNFINGGALPADMIEKTTSVIGPTLGLEAFEKSILAGGIGLVLIFVMMIVVYKLPGFVASIALIIYTLLVLTTMSLIGVVLTLSGIAGLILSIGMAVDANVLIFERIREEIDKGKTIRTSVDTGFKRALTSIIDSNVTTLIAGFVLYYFGVGSIKGFGVTLMIGIIASVLTSVLITKYLLKLIVRITGEGNPKLYGAKGC